MTEQIARYKPGDNLTVKPSGEEALEAGRFVTIDGIEDGAYTADHTGKEAKDKPSGVTQRTTADPEVEDASSVDLLTEIVRTGSVARVESAGEIKAGEQVETGADGTVAAYDKEGKKGIPVGRALTSVKKEEMVEVDVY